MVKAGDSLTENVHQQYASAASDALEGALGVLRSEAYDMQVGGLPRACDYIENLALGTGSGMYVQQ